MTALPGRSDLKSKFQNGKTLAANHFHELIQSSINKPDDRFYGAWSAGAYPKGAVVYHNGMLWESQKELCSKAESPPGDDCQEWDSEVARLKADLAVIRQEMVELRQWVTLLNLGIGAIVLYWLLSALYRLLAGLV